MSEVLTKAVWDGNTGEQTIVPLTPEEIAEREVQIAAAAEEQAAREAEVARIAALKASAITKLTTGAKLTAEEAALLVP
jgi:hypothetical protein